MRVKGGEWIVTGAILALFLGVFAMLMAPVLIPAFSDFLSPEEPTQWELTRLDSGETTRGDYRHESEFAYFRAGSLPVDSILREEHPTGLTTRQHTLKSADGSRQTLVEVRQEDGTLHSRYELRDGKLHGPCEYWNADQLMRSGQYENGQQAGLWREWNAATGQMEEITYPVFTP